MCLISASQDRFFLTVLLPMIFSLLNRGFRQATRGADTGAFHHPLFQRDQPDLCVDMVCQRSRDRKSSQPQAAAQAHSHAHQQQQQRSKGPLKKRSPSGPAAAAPPPPQAQGEQQPPVASTLLTKEALDNMCESQQLQTDCSMDVCTTVYHRVSAVVSVEDSASENNSCGGSSDQERGSCRRSSSLALKKKQQQQSPQPPRMQTTVTADAFVVQLALQQRDEMERMRLAKAMLFNAYMNALQAASSSP
jgi:hypothetical protein